MMKDVLTAFSPASDFLAVATADGRIKTWDVGSGHLRGEFVDGAVSTSGASTVSDDGSGHLAVDYSCITWSPLPLGSKKARKKGNKRGPFLLLVLGTAAGDVLAWDASLGQLKWRTNDCNAGGVKALARSKCGKNIYAAGADGMVCEMDSGSGQILEKFRAAKTAVSRITLSPDGGILLTASAELKTFDLSSKKRIRKFSGHPGEVTALAFSKDGKYAFSSSRGERQVSVWQCDTGAVFSLSCDQSVVFLDGSGFHQETGSPLKVLALSETGVAYLWQAETVEELTSVKPTVVSVARNPGTTKGGHGCVLAAVLVTGEKDTTTVQIAHGTTAKPAFEQIYVSSMGTTVVLGAPESGALLPASHPMEIVTAKKTGVTVLGPDNAADAVISKPHIESDIKTPARTAKKRPASVDLDENDVPEPDNADEEENTLTVNEEDELTMEERLASLGIVDKGATNGDKPETVVKVVPPRGDSLRVLLSQALQSDDNSMMERVLSVQDEKLIRNTISKLRPSEAGKFLNACMFRLETRPRRAVTVVSWLRAILLQHSASLMTNPAMQPVLTTLYQLIEARMTVFRPLLALSGRLDLITTQILGREAGLGDEVEEVVEAAVYEEGDSEVEVEEVEEGEEVEESGLSDSDKEMSDANETMVSDSEGEEAVTQ